MIDIGFEISIFVVAAICGNFWQESTINPGLYEGRKEVPLKDNSVYGGYGLGQWTNSSSHGVYRRTALAEWLEANGYAYDSGEGQLEYLIYEDTWYSTGIAGEYGSLTDYLASDDDDIDRLVEQYMVGWEGISDGTLDIRIEAAYKVYGYILDHDGEDPGEWIASNQYLSEDDRLHNALLVYYYLNGKIKPRKDDTGRLGNILIPIMYRWRKNIDESW